MRLPNWEDRLGEYLAELRTRTYAYGRHDCCTFAGGAVEAMTGVDPMPEFRGRYTTSRGAARALRKFGAGTLVATLNTKFEAIPVALARRGDLVMVSMALGVGMSGVALLVGNEAGREGLVAEPRSLWERAWAVPFA